MVYKESGKLVFNTIKKLKKEHEFLKELDGLIVGSKYLDKHIRRHNIPAKKLFINPLYPSNESIEAPEMKIEERERSILFAGSLIKGKGVDILLKSLKESKSKLTLYIAGEGQKRQEYENLAKSIGILSQVKFLAEYHKKN